ncbi:MAG: ATP-dependent RNA helicase [Spirochaetales bacterium]|nr:ATP-dependent RNA helicase [Spirochaetales bacterium]MCF7937168.1 ATP-dependent RNA helicase [Spirochaetales bacterium]
MQPHELPVYKQKERILTALEKNQVLVVESPTGSGKTTQLPIILHEAGYSNTGIIGITQPRRIAALSVCEYISKQLDNEVGDLAGYKMRFEDITSEKTRLKIVTDGTLLQEMKTDFYLTRYNVIIVDEAHERSLNIDFILGLLKQVLEFRSDLKVIISSATINAEIFSEYFNECPIVHIDTEMYPVQVVYDPPKDETEEESYHRKIADIVGRIMLEKREGDILIFLSGERSIKECISLLESRPYSKHLHVLPLYARLAKEEQERVFNPAPKGKTKVIVATNIAETSITIDGITSVIDSGLAKMNYYNPRTFTSSLIEGPISRASCNQRRGRAGRTQPGTCYRLYSKKDYESRDLFTKEEILRTDLSEVVLRMAEIGIQDFESFDFISPPGKPGLIAAVETLLLFEAIDDERNLTEIGSLMSRFPLMPKHSRMLVAAIMEYPEVLEEIIIAASFLTTNNPFLLPDGEELAARRAHHSFRHDYGDFISYLNIYHAFIKAEDQERFCKDYYFDIKVMTEIANVKQQLEEIVAELGIPIQSGGGIRKYLIAASKGLIQFVCVRSGRRFYRSVTAEQIFIHPGSVLFQENPKYIVAGEIVKTSRMYARSVSPLNKEWLESISDHLVKALVEPEEKKGAPEKKKTEEKTQKRESNLLQIGNESFEVKSYKGKKNMAVLPYEKINRVVHTLKLTSLRPYRSMRAVILLNDNEILSGTKLNTIIKVLPMIDPDLSYADSWPRGENLHIPEDQDKVCEWVGKCLKLCRKKPTSKQLGFLTLVTEGSGRYWFVSSRSLHSSVGQSMASIDTLVDEIGDDLTDRQQETINSTYRRLSSFFEI